MPKNNNWRNEKIKLRLRDGDLCCYCGYVMIFGGEHDGDGNEKYATIEHVIPQRKNGGSKIENLKLACRKCNNERGKNLKKQKNLTPIHQLGEYFGKLKHELH